MFDTFRGLPVHALVVHAVVILVPLAAIGLVAIAVRPSWRRAYAPLVAIFATAGLALVPVATRSGHELQERLNAGGVVAEQIEDHEKMASLVLWPTLAMWVVAVALLVLDRRGRTGRPMTVLAVVAVVVSVAALAQVAIAGELGSTAVWKCTVGPC
jgi:bacteriorhodopsin